MLLDASARARLLDRFGPDVSSWCDEFPALVERFARRWDLRVREARAGNTGRTLLCGGADGGLRVLKLTPDPSIAIDEVTALRVWARCSRVVQVLDADLDAGAILLEGIEPGTELRGPDVPWAQLGELFGQLHGVPAEGPFPPLAERIAFIYDLYERRLTGSPAEAHLPLSLLHRGRDQALALTADGPVALVHGDLHPGNVLDGGARGIVAIDPRPCLGDPAIDIADWAMLPMRTGAPLDDGIDRVRRYAPDVERLRGWCVALAPLAALGPLLRGGPTPYTDALLALA